MVLEGGKSKIFLEWNQQARFHSEMRCLLLACRQLPSCCVLIWPLLCVSTGVERERQTQKSISEVSSYEDINPTGAPPLWPYVTLIAFLEVSSPNTAPLGVKTSAYGGGGVVVGTQTFIHNTFFPIECSNFFFYPHLLYLKSRLDVLNGQTLSVNITQAKVSNAMEC